MFPKKKCMKDEEGAVIVGPRNFYTKKGKKGGADGALFSMPKYNAIGDPYIQRSTKAGGR